MRGCLKARDGVDVEVASVRLEVGVSEWPPLHCLLALAMLILMDEAHGLVVLGSHHTYLLLSLLSLMTNWS